MDFEHEGGEADQIKTKRRTKRRASSKALEGDGSKPVGEKKSKKPRTSSGSKRKEAGGTHEPTPMEGEIADDQGSDHEMTPEEVACKETLSSQWQHLPLT